MALSSGCTHLKAYPELPVPMVATCSSSGRFCRPSKVEDRMGKGLACGWVVGRAGNCTQVCDRVSDSPWKEQACSTMGLHFLSFRHPPVGLPPPPPPPH